MSLPHTPLILNPPHAGFFVSIEQRQQSPLLHILSSMSIEQQAEAILRNWAQQFHQRGDYDEGIKIVHDGYLTDEDGNEDEDQPCYAIFVHRDSSTGSFPAHDTSHGLIAHRPSEEACFYVWLNLATNQDQEINTPDTELNVDLVYRLIVEIESKYIE